MRATSVIVMMSAWACTCSDQASITKVAEVVKTPKGGGRRVPFLIQNSVPSGSTAIDPQKGLEYELLLATQDEVAGIVQTFAASSGFHDLYGARVSAAAAVFDPMVVQNNSGESVSIGAPKVILRPTSALATDTWYEFRPGLGDGTSYSVKSDLTFRNDLSVRFFTGSAPAIRYLARDTAHKGGRGFVSFYLTEPVDLSDLADGIKLFAANDRVPGCIYREETCVAPAQGLKVVSAEFQFEQVSDGFAMNRVAVRSGVAGAARNFAQAWTFAGQLNRFHQADPAEVSYDLTASPWVPCADRDRECWFVRGP